ncbi:MAG: o-succinylbenzoate synthase [bacterium]|nr:o-succinylbenzoate synthase [bacterium]
MKISQVSLHMIPLSVARPMVAASTVLSERPIMALRFISDGGLEVWSECVALPEAGYSSETQSVAWDVLVGELLPALKNRSFSHPEQVEAALDWVAPGYSMSKAAIEMAFWALYAQEQGQPLWQVLGGTNGVIPGGVVLGFDDGSALLKGTHDVASIEKYSRVTLKIRPGYDLDYVSKVRQVLPESITMAVDGNESFCEDDMTMLMQMGQTGLAFIEQPFERGRQDLHCRLQQNSPSPVALDESILNQSELTIAIEAGALGVLNLKPGRVGGFSPALGMMTQCNAANIAVKIGGMYESGLGKSYNLALASVCDGGLAHDISDARWHWDSDVLQTDFASDDRGRFTVNSAELYRNIMVGSALKMSLKNHILTF